MGEDDLVKVNVRKRYAVEEQGLLLAVVMHLKLKKLLWC